MHIFYELAFYTIVYFVFQQLIQLIEITNPPETTYKFTLITTQNKPDLDAYFAIFVLSNDIIFVVSGDDEQRGLKRNQVSHSFFL